MLVLFRPVAADGLTDSLTTINKDMQVGAANERDTPNKRPQLLPSERPTTGQLVASRNSF
jgi:hypothetical protein